MNQFNQFSENQQSYYDPNDYCLERHGFVTFWLWFCIVANVVLAAIFFMGSDSFLMDYPIIVCGVLGVCTLSVVGLFMLLNWRKLGFWLVVTAAVINVLTVVYTQYEMSQIYSMLGISVGIDTAEIVKAIGQEAIRIGILFGVLQIKKNGVSCWSQLE